MVREREQKQAQKGRKKKKSAKVNEKQAEVNNTPFTLQWVDPVVIDPQLFK
jgi:hypothetical protein